MSRKNLYIVLLGVWIWLLLLLNLAWLATDRTPPAWDQAAHIRSAVLANRWFLGEFWGDFGDLVRAFGGYPPLIYLIGGAWSLLVGIGVGQISFLNSIFLVAGMVGVYLLAQELVSDKKEGGFMPLLASIIFSLIPVIYDISRNFLLDLPLTVFIIFGLYFYLKSHYLVRLGWGGMWLLCLGAASLTKLNGFIYFGPMVLWSLYLAIKNKDLRIVFNLVGGGLVYLATVGWWWVINWKNIYDYLTGLAGQGEKLTDPMNLLDLNTWLHYFRLFFLHQMGPFGSLGLLMGLTSWWKEAKINWKKWSVLVFFFLFNYVVFTIIRNKDFRFTLPLLPIAALIIAFEIKGIWSSGKKWQKVVTVFLVGWLLFNYIENSFGWPIKKPVVASIRTFVVGDIELLGFDEYPVRSPLNEVWPQRELLVDLRRISEEQGRKLRLLVLMNREEINDNNLGMFNEVYRINAFEPGSVGAVEKLGSEEEIAEMLSGFNAALVPSLEVDPAPFYGINLEAYKQARDYIWENESEFEWVGEYETPKYGKLYLVLMP